MSNSKHVSREELLTGEFRGNRRVFKILTAIELRTAYLQSETRRAVNAYLLGGGEFKPRLDRDYLAGLKLRATGNRPTLAALDRYASQWAALIPDDATLRTALAHALRERYGAEAGPRTLAALGQPESMDAPAEAATASTGDALDLEAMVEWVRIPGGSLLCKAGDEAEALYIVVTGRLGATTLDGQPTPEMGQGTIIGAEGVLTGEVRSATVYALRDTDVLRVPAGIFHEIVHHYPEALRRVSRDMAARLQAQSSRRDRTSAVMTIALVPAGPGVDHAHYRRDMIEALETLVDVSHVTRTRIENELDVHLDTDLKDPTETARILAWLRQRETAGGCVVYEAGSEWSEWSASCVRQADRVLLIANAGDTTSAESVVEHLRALGVMAKIELVLIHPADTIRPSGTACWLRTLAGQHYHHVRLGDAADFGRLARRLLGQARGIVLSGGGARGFAHAGAIRALREAGIEIDLFGGTSMGALIAAAAVRGADDLEMLEMCKVFASRRALLDPTLPLTSLYRTRKVTRMLATVLGDTAIEDLWRPFFCVSSDLTHSEPRIHERDSLQLAVRASLAIPVIFAPLLHEGSLLVDGGVMNNFPLDVMRERCEGGTVIGVWANPPAADATEYAFGTDVSGWRVLLSRLGIGKPGSAPSIVSIATRTIEVNSQYRMRSPTFLSLADVLIQPQLQQFASLDFDSYTAIVQAGYDEARHVIETWQVETSKFAASSRKGGV